jgi:hypothetical protein
VAAKYILAVLACAFLTAGGLHLGRDGGKQHPQSRTWLLVGAIFGIVSAWLFLSPGNP